MSSSRADKIPIIDLPAQYAKIRDEVSSAIDEVAASQQFVLGPAVARFEADMAAYLQSAHAVGVASGSDALLLALMALDIGPGDGVITTPFTFFSTVSSITRLGATALFADIDLDSYLLSAKSVERFFNQRTSIKNGQTVETKTGLRIKALLPVHLFGQCCAMAEFTALAKRYRLSIVEDVAQACGARMEIAGQVKFAGAIGDLGCFSFFPSKTLGAFGDGGLVSAHCAELAARLRMLRMHGESAKYYHEVTGINSRLDSIQAAVLSVKRKYLDIWCDQRVQRAETYHRLFTASGLLGKNVLAIPSLSKGKTHVFNNYVVRVQRRDQLREFLADHSVQSEIYYPLPLHRQPCFAHLGYQQGDFPLAELAAAQVLALPLYPELTAAQAEIVVEKIAAFYRR